MQPFILRRKQYLRCTSHPIIEKLSKLPQLADFDMSPIELDYQSQHPKSSQRTDMLID